MGGKKKKKSPLATFSPLTTPKEAEDIISLSKISFNILTSIVRRHSEEESLEHTISKISSHLDLTESKKNV